MQDMQANGAALGRINYMFGRDYYQNFSGGTVSGAWGALYSGILPDITAIEGKGMLVDSTGAISVFSAENVKHNLDSK